MTIRKLKQTEYIDEAVEMYKRRAHAETILGYIESNKPACMKMSRAINLFNVILNERI